MTSPDPAPPADPTTYRRSGFGLGFWVAIAFAMVCTIGGIFIGVFWNKVFPEPAAQSSATGAIAPVRPSSADPVESVVSPLVDPALTEDTSLAPPPADVSSLALRVQRLEADQSRVLEAATTALATAALLQAAQTSRPFASELTAVERLAPGSVDIALLRPLAVDGAPTRALLSADFSGAASRAIAASRRPAGDASIMDRVRYGFASVVTIRRIDHTEGTGVNAVLARAETLVQEGDLESALAELDALPAGPRLAMTGWIDHARRRVEIDRRMAALRETSLQALSISLATRQ